MQPLFSRWFNLDKRCVVMVGSSAISIEQLQEFQEASPKVGEQETSKFCEGGHHWLYCPPNIFKMTCDRKCLAKHIYYKKSWFKNGDKLSIILLWNFAFCFGITSHSLTKHVFYLSLCCSEVRRCLAFHFWQNIFIELQHAIKANQSWKIKSILIAETDSPTM